MKHGALLILALLAAASPARALNVRTWVSGKGADQAGCGPVANPCRTLQYAHDNTSPNGEVNVLDSAGYGSLAITKGLTIASEAAFAGVLGTSSVPAINIATGTTEKVILRGLAIQGAGVTESGIFVASVGELIVENCTLAGFTGAGVRGRMDTSGRIEISGSTFRGNDSGIVVDPIVTTGATSITMMLDRLTMTGNRTAIRIIGGQMTAASTIRFVVSNSAIAGSRKDGFGTGVSSESATANAAVRGMVETTSISDSDRALFASGAATIHVGRSALFGNGRSFGVNSGTIYTFGDNHVTGNDIVGTAPVAAAPM